MSAKQIDNWYIENVFRRFFDRYPSDIEFQEKAADLNNRQTWADIRDTVAQSDNFLEILEEKKFKHGSAEMIVDHLFVALLQRNPDPSGRLHYQVMVNEKNGVEKAINGICESEEYSRDGYRLVFIEYEKGFPSQTKLAALVENRMSYIDLAQWIETNPEYPSLEGILTDWQGLSDVSLALGNQLIESVNKLQQIEDEKQLIFESRKYLDMGERYYRMLSTMGKGSEGTPTVDEMIEKFQKIKDKRQAGEILDLSLIY